MAEPAPAAPHLRPGRAAPGWRPPALAAVAGTSRGRRTAARHRRSGRARRATAARRGRVPAANALALVVLACWGVLLVTRGGSAGSSRCSALLAALGTVATVVVGFGSAPDARPRRLRATSGSPTRT